jgi:hypothetical protein
VETPNPVRELQSDEQEDEVEVAPTVSNGDPVARLTLTSKIC